MTTKDKAGESCAPMEAPQPGALSDQCLPGTVSVAEQVEQQEPAAVEEPTTPLPISLVVEEPTPPPPIPPVVDVHDLDWDRIGALLEPFALRARMPETVERLEAVLDLESNACMLFDDHRESSSDRVLKLRALSDEPLWFIGDLHGDLLALDAALALIGRESARENVKRPRIVLLGDMFDDAGYGLETVLRIFELILERPQSVCLIAGNHDEALGYDGTRFSATVSPSDFFEFLNDNLAHAWIGRVGKLVVRMVANAPRALFFPDGLLVAHGGFPLTDLHERLAETRNWNDPQCLTDFVWSRAHPRARRKLPNRMSRGSQFGYEDFAAFCALSATLGRPVTHMVRGHDHVDERYEIYPAYAGTPVLTTVALSRRLPRELFGPFARVPTLARWIRGSLPQVYRLHLPERLIRDCYPEENRDAEPAKQTGETAA